MKVMMAILVNKIEDKRNKLGWEKAKPIIIEHLLGIIINTHTSN